MLCLFNLIIETAQRNLSVTIFASYLLEFEKAHDVNIFVILFKTTYYYIIIAILSLREIIIIFLYLFSSLFSRKRFKKNTKLFVIFLSRLQGLHFDQVLE